MQYVLLTISIIAEVFATTMMKLSVGFTVPLFTGLTLVGYAISFSLLIITLKTMPLGLVYGIWGGVGTVLTTIIGIVFWHEAFGLFTGLGIALVIGGVILLNQGTEDIEKKRAAAAANATAAATAE